MSKPYYKKGEEVVCTNGHVIGSFPRDMFTGDPFGEPIIEKPDGTNLYKAGDLIEQPCPECGAPFVRSTLYSHQFHLKGRGWV